MELSKIIIGAMRFKDRSSAIATIHAAIDAGFNYIDTSPCYCYRSEEENSERWVGEAIRDPKYRDRVMVSAKCTPGNGGTGLGEFNGTKGFGVRTIEQLQNVFHQSMTRLETEEFAYYHLWTTHTPEQFAEAFKPGGWCDGVMSLRGRWHHLGITTHADTPTILEFLKSGRFETVTMPLNIVNRTRLGVLDYCREHGIAVIAMNPLAGGFLASQERLKELAFRYLMALPDVHILVGFSSPEEVWYAKQIEETTPEDGVSAESILAEVDQMLGTTEPRCTACGYCAPCPQGINVGACLSYYNIFKYLGLESARKAFNDKQWESGLKLSNCKTCGICSSRCPNMLPLEDIIADAQRIMYVKQQSAA